MILFKFPQKKIVLDCFTHLEHVLTTAPIVPATKLLPEWWKALPRTYTTPQGEHSTMRSCVGMTDYYKASIVMPLWSDMRINIKSPTEYNWKFSDGLSNAVYHEVDKQAAGFLPEYAHIKITSPWYLKTKENIQWVWSHPTYAFPNSHEIATLPGVVNYKHQSTSNINIFVFAKKEQTIFIPQGQPLVHMIPMSDRKVKIVRHLIDEKEAHRMNLNDCPITFIRKYQRLVTLKEQFKDCPFHDNTKGK
jgi:hypothetical protein